MVVVGDSRVFFMFEQNIENKSGESYKKVTNAFFYASLSLIPIFAVPAFSALFLGRYLDGRFETGKLITLVLLLLALITSWIITLKKAVKMNSEYRRVREEMKKEQNK